MNTIRVDLTPEQIELAKANARKRNSEAKAAGKHQKYKAEWSQSPQLHLTGSLGECVFLVGMGIDAPVLSVNTYKSEPDVVSGVVAQFPDGCEVRTRNYNASHPTELIVRPDDNPDLPFVHVILDADRMGGDIIGWIMGKDAMRPGWLCTHGNRPAAYFVPDHALREVVA